MSEKKVLIIGAGIVGLSSAWFLSKKGYQVTILDAGDGTQNCSVGNAGFFCPSHVVPLASPGIITQGLKWMLDEKSPFYVRPRLNRDLISWGLKFRKAATKARVEKAAPILHALTTRSQALAEEIISEGNLDVGYTRSGLLMICKSQKELSHEMETAEIARSFGQEVEILSTSEAEKLNPCLEVNMVGAVYYPNDTMVSPHVFIKSFQQSLMAKGVDIHFNTKATKINAANGRITGVASSEGYFQADEYVVTAGSGTSSFLKPLGLKLPMLGGKGYSFTISSPVVTPQTPAILADGKVSMSPLVDGLRFSGTMEIDGDNPKVNNKRIEGIIETVMSFLPQFKRSDFDNIKPWAGFRPCSPDGLPYLGKPQQYPNLTIAAGHAMLGVTLGPVSGEIVARFISGSSQDIDLSLLKVDRYE